MWKTIRLRVQANIGEGLGAQLQLPNLLNAMPETPHPIMLNQLHSSPEYEVHPAREGSLVDLKRDSHRVPAGFRHYSGAAFNP